MRNINKNMTQADRKELLGRLIDIVEDWLEDKGFSPKDFPNEDRSFPIDPDEAIIFGDDYDYLADRFAKVIGISRDYEESNDASGLRSWGKREVEIACEKEKSDWNDEYESALKAYNSLLEDMHGGSDVSKTKAILDRLVDLKPLTPIYDVDDEWRLLHDFPDSPVVESIYQCKRMGSLFKHTYTDGRVTYRDTRRAVGVAKNEKGEETLCENGLIDDIVDELFPIKMPYMPENKDYRVYCEEILYNKNIVDYDTIGIYYLIKPDGTKIKINRFFAETDGEFKEIGEQSYQMRKRLVKCDEESSSTELPTEDFLINAYNTYFSCVRNFQYDYNDGIPKINSEVGWNRIRDCVLLAYEIDDIEDASLTDDVKKGMNKFAIELTELIFRKVENRHSEAVTKHILKNVEELLKGRDIDRGLAIGIMSIIFGKGEKDEQD